jgi:molybdopterin molybdotransferase
MALESVRSEITAPVRSPAGRRSYLRGVIDRNRGLATPAERPGPHQMATLGQANALVIVPEWVVQMDAGETVDVLVLP